MKKERSPRNKTLTLTATDRERLSPGVVRLAEPCSEEQVADRIICGDLFEVVDCLPDAMAQLIIADPPYNLDKQFGCSSFTACSRQEYVDYLRRWIPAVCRKLSPTGSLYICCDWGSSSAVEEVLRANLTVLNRITWQREKGRGATRNWKNAMEDIWFAVKDPNHYTFNLDAVKQQRKVIAPYRDNKGPRDWQQVGSEKFRATCPSNIWDDITIPYWSMPENTEHPTQKPEKLIAKLILASSNEGDLVFDPFGGSGTTAVVANKLGRRYCSVEIDEEYCITALRRLEMAADNRDIQGYTDGCFWDRNTTVAQMLTKRKKPAVSCGKKAAKSSEAKPAKPRRSTKKQCDE